MLRVLRMLRTSRMLRMLRMLRRRKIMKLRRVILRRKINPKTGKQTLREPAQSKGTWTCHKNLLCEPAQAKGTLTWTFRVEIYNAKAGRKSRGRQFVLARAIDRHVDISHEPFCIAGR